MNMPCSNTHALNRQMVEDDKADARGESLANLSKEVEEKTLELTFEEIQLEGPLFKEAVCGCGYSEGDFSDINVQLNKNDRTNGAERVLELAMFGAMMEGKILKPLKEHFRKQAESEVLQEAS